MRRMNYEPKIIFNPTKEQREFWYGGRVFVFGPGEKKLLNGEEADHVLRYINGPFKEYEPTTDDALVESSNVAYDKMPWREIVSLASERGLFTPGTTKKEVIKLLIEADEQRA